MFTGIVEEQGVVRRAEMDAGVLRLEVGSRTVAAELDRGDSICVNGVCLTAVRAGRRRFTAEVMGETLDRTTLRSLQKGRLVNLELPVRLIDRLGGHLVQGHVDGVGEVAKIDDAPDTRRVWVAADDDVGRFIVPKGSVTVDGVSLTVVDVDDGTFQVALIPHTLEATTLGELDVGDEVNIEADVIAKYVHLLMERK